MKDGDLSAIDRQRKDFDMGADKGIYVSVDNDASTDYENSPLYQETLKRIKSEMHSAVLKNATIGSSEATLTEDIRSRMDTLLSTGVVSNHEVDVYTVVETWKDLYPTLGKRVKAIFALNVFKLGYNVLEPKWYHILLGYKLKSRMDISEEFYDELVHPEFELEEAVKKYVNVTWWYELKGPATYLQADLKITPMRSIKEIKVDFVVHIGDKEKELV